jgi:hypothetical protein
MKHRRIWEDTRFKVQAKKGMNIKIEWGGGLGWEEKTSGRVWVSKVVSRVHRTLGWRGPGENGRRGKAEQQSKYKNKNERFRTDPSMG